LPELKIYAFDSAISANAGELSNSLEQLKSVREAEIERGVELIDGFMFRESYVYMDENGKVLDSQLILDDVESIAGDSHVYRYDEFGVDKPKKDKGYLNTLLGQLQQIFNRSIDIGITEYLPAGPLPESESDTSSYKDIDFMIHYADLAGIYAELGLDVISTFMFADGPDQAKAYVDKFGNKSTNYPLREQLAKFFKGDILQVERPAQYTDLKVKVYAVKNDKGYFILLLNKDTLQKHSINLSLESEFDFYLSLHKQSYNSIIIEKSESGERVITLTGIGPF
jgi:hypothetical protein